MKTILLLTGLVISTAVNAQSSIIVTSADFAHGGDTVRMSQANDNGYDFAATGPNHNWNFIDLVPTSQSLKDFRSMTGVPAFINFMFGAFASSKYSANYFIESTTLPIDQITSILPVTITDIFQYTRFTSANDSVNSVGYSMSVDFGSGATSLPFRSDTIETRYVLPLNYGDTYTSRGYTNIDFNPVYNAVWRQYRQRNSIVDGWGIVSTPFGQYDVLRVKHEITESDSIFLELPFIGGTWIPLDLPLTREYEWWANGQKEPILKFTTNEIVGTETVTAIEYRDIYRGLDASLDELSASFKMFPNPVVNEVTIESDQVITAVKVFGMNGALLLGETPNSVNTYVLDVSHLPAGNYLLQLESGNLKGQQSFIKR